MWWIDAASTGDGTDNILSGLAALAMRLCPQWAVTAGTDARAAWAISWLQIHPGWLLIFDNVEDPRELNHYLGTLQGGHFLATSRISTGWHSIAPTMPLGLLDPDAAVTLLCILAFGDEHALPPGTREDAEALAAELGYLPLALEQAGAYLHETGMALADYRTLLGQVIDSDAGGIDSERTIGRIWDHSLVAVETRNPQSVTVLSAIAWFAPADIPRALLAPLCPEPAALDEALGVLRAYSMIAYGAEQSLHVHRLVQTVLRHRGTTAPGAYRPGREEAERLIQQATPAAGAAATEWHRLLPHFMAVADSAPEHSPPSTDTVDAYEAAAQHLYQPGRDGHAIPLRTAVLAQRVETLGSEHPDTLTARHNLALSYGQAGRTHEAIALLEQVLAEREQLLGSEHPDTLTARHNLALSHAQAGRTHEAIVLLEQVLAEREQLLGSEHPDTLTARHNLAHSYWQTGQMREAVTLQKQVLADRERLLSSERPDTLIRDGTLVTALDDMAGLGTVRDALTELKNRIRLHHARGKSLPALLFVGPPGTGKTTVARHVGEWLQSLGLLRKGHVLEVTCADLAAECVGQSASKVRAVVHQALDGVLFIDEAYALRSSEAVDSLIGEMEYWNDRLVVIAAGDPRTMDAFLLSNSSMASRFTERVEFPPYSTDELVEVLRRRSASEGYILTPEAAERAGQWFDRRRTDPIQFSNAREVPDVFSAMEIRLARRFQADPTTNFTFIAEDVPPPEE
ncbi:hypothetical protein AQI95_40670 [Streptomyces yokosukanensis]|uniref:AAA+ ATPase domain-containing protein n=1 Tax=Streptomyces yokosukanensis TaxID=67386 RepID=A0A101NTJ6_9ACTN|nr:hypothetical protein AQI95_40670 [Streptomyces yokosukanensis]